MHCKGSGLDVLGNAAIAQELGAFLSECVAIVTEDVIAAERGWGGVEGDGNII